MGDFIAILSNGEDGPPEYLGRYNTYAEAESVLGARLIDEGTLFSVLTWYDFADAEEAQAEAYAYMTQRLPAFANGLSVCDDSADARKAFLREQTQLLAEGWLSELPPSLKVDHQWTIASI